jgi:predicted ATPase/class 3 adenylate cyclase
MAAVTFLMTDIEGSTRLWEELPEAMGPALEAHDAILRDAVMANGGSVVKTTGDGLLATFTETDQALAAAIGGQLGLAVHKWGATGPLRVRMAAHCGPAQARDADYYGPAVNRVARLLAIGHGGQILVSGAASDLAKRNLPSGAELLDRGEHRLRDLDRPEHVFQLLAPGLAREFPALRSLNSYRTNLPSQLTSFVGRERELEDVRSMVDDHRLVTLIGTGGTGKTRLMVQVGAERLDRHADGVWLTELASIRDAGMVVREVARCLGVGEEPGRAALDTLTDYLRSKSMLLLIDNCEHLVNVAADLAERLLAACPDLYVMATSREALGVPGEVVFQVPSLTIPGERRHDADWLAEVIRCEAVRLFVDRATAAVPSFALTPGNASAVVEICRRLDGIPLAIELAAARVTVLSVEEIAEGLSDRFRLLTGGRRTALPRQQTLQALVDWSWDLLTAADQQLLARLSVFAGGWTLESAAAVTRTDDDGDQRTARLAILDGLTRLVDRSLVTVDHGGTTRYHMLETIRQYARDRLLTMGDGVSMRERHVDHFLAFAHTAEQALVGPEMIPWLQRTDAEIDNLRAAMEWSFDSDVVRGLRMLVALMPYWRSRSYALEAVEGLERGCELAGRLPPPAEGEERDRQIVLARLYAATAFANATWASGTRALRWAAPAVELAESLGDPSVQLEAFVGMALASVFSGAGEEAQQRLNVAGIQLAESKQDWWLLSMVHGGMALFLANMGRLADAEAELDRSTEAAAITGNPAAIAFAAVSRGRVAGASGRLDQARHWLAIAATDYEAMGDRRSGLIARSELAHALRRGGALDEARDTYRQTLAEWLDIGNRGAIANQFECLAMIATVQGEADVAARLFGVAEILREKSSSPMLSYERAQYEPSVEETRQQLGADAFAAAWAAGRGMPLDEAAALSIGSA